jgi:hypothetical protein
MRGFTTLVLASSRMLFRSPATLRVAFATPLLFAALIALYDRLEFETASGSVDFFDYIAVGVAAWYITYTAQHGMTGAAASYRAQGVLKRLAVTPISSLEFISAQVPRASPWRSCRRSSCSAPPSCWAPRSRSAPISPGRSCPSRQSC